MVFKGFQQTIRFRTAPNGGSPRNRVLPLPRFQEMHGFPVFSLGYPPESQGAPLGALWALRSSPQSQRTESIAFPVVFEGFQ